MDIPQLRGLASVGTARAALLERQVPGQGTEKRGGHQGLVGSGIGAGIGACSGKTWE